jgi:hypothetical protein
MTNDSDTEMGVIVIGCLAVVHGGFWGLVGYWAGWFIWAP